MTEIKIKDVQSYTISLDSLDLTHLGKYIHTTRTAKMPLWTKKKLDGETEYCQVQLVRDYNDEECYSEETIETTNCHICSVEVPVTCYKEHTESEPHVTLENIFQNILERLSKQMKITIINNDKGFDQDVFYHCVPCSKIIKIDNKQKHEMSPYHIRSQKKLSIVKEFYNIFNKDYPANCGDVEKVGNEEMVYEESTLSEKNMGTEYVQIDTTDNGLSNHTNRDIFSNDETNTVCSSNDRTTKLDSDDNLISSSFEEYYFKQIIRKHDLKVDLPIIDGDFVHVANPSGIKVKILRDNFHSFTSRNQLIYCQLCDSLFKPEEKNEHKVTERHARNIFIKVNEKFARLHCNNIWSHCLICNDVYHTSYISKHCLVDENHIRTFKSSKIPDVCQNNEESNIAIFSTVIATEHTPSSESGERKMVEYIDEYKERSESKKLTNEKGVYKSKENKHNDKKYVGGINMAKHRLDDHISDKNHIEKTKQVSPHCVQKVLCGLCNVAVPQDQIEYHNAGTTHWSKSIKNILTGVSIGLQAYLSEDEPKSSDLSDKPKDRNKNENKHEAKRNENPSKNNNAINNENVITDDNVFNNKNATTKDENTIVKDKNKINEDENAIDKDKSIITEDVNTIAKDENTIITKDKNAITKDENTMTKDENAITKDENAITNDENAITKDENAITKNENAITKDDNAITKDKNAITNDENVIIEDGNVIIEDVNVIIEDVNTITGDENIPTKHYEFNNENAITEDDNAITKDKNTITNDENVIIEDGNVIIEDVNVIIEDVNTITGDENIPTKHYEFNNENAITEDEYFTRMFNSDIAPPNPFRFADSSKTKVTCAVCDINIDNTQQSIDTHENSSKHEISVRELLKFHSLKISNYFNFNLDNNLKTEILYCESCNINVMDIWEHINTERHTALLQLEFETSAESLKTFVYKCKNIKGHSKASKYREFYNMLLKTNKVVKFHDWHYCSICDKELIGIEGSEIDHMLSEEHETELAKIFDSR